MKIGILALQGAVREHKEMLLSLNTQTTSKKKFPDSGQAGMTPNNHIEVIEVRYPSDLEGLSGIILGGGESTAIGKLLKKQKLYSPLQKAIQKGLPVWGTCAGAILLAKEGSEYSLNVGDFSLQRNGFGRQLASFSTPLEIKGISKNFEAIFIRAPRFSSPSVPPSLREQGAPRHSKLRSKRDHPELNGGSSKKKIETLATYQGEPIFLKQGNIWASTFHPELGTDPAVHKAFIKFCEERKNLKKS